MQRVPSLNQNGEYASQSDLDEEELKNQPYYFDDLSTEEAEALLRDRIRKEGAFLVRRRKKDDFATKPYAISVYYDSSMHHYRIKRYDNGKFSIDTQDQRPTMFNSIPELIKFFDERNTCRCKLTTRYNNLLANFKSDFKNDEKVYKCDDNLDDLPYFLGEMSLSDVAKHLKEIKQDEIFFIRKSSLNKNSPYEMCIYYKSSVYNLKITRTSYDAFSIENSDASFDSIPDLVRHYNYNKLKLNNDNNIKLQIYSRYLRE